MTTDEREHRFKHLVGFNSTSLVTIRERYTNVTRWVWQDGVLKDHDTMEPVSIAGDDNPAWEYVVFLPGDVNYLLTQLAILSAAYDELYSLYSQTLTKVE